MSFLLNIFHDEKKEESVALVDIGLTSVAGAYAHYTEGASPILIYSRHVPVEARKNEQPEAAMLRALQILGEALIREGIPALARATGSGKVSGVLVSIDAPWQNTSVRTEHFEQGRSFVFTKDLVAEKLGRIGAAIHGKLLVDESIIGSILNGYETNDPYGRRVHRASVVILSSFVDEKVTGHILSVLRSIYHTNRIFTIAGSSLRFQAMRQIFPHERTALIFDVVGPLTSIALLRKDIFVAAANVAGSAGSWMHDVMRELADLAKHYPLPRTIFVLAREPEIVFLKKSLDAVKLSELWLSDNPPKIVFVLPSHLNGLVRQASETSHDPLLLLMALFWPRHTFN
ncbi:MAG TPA: hypothetical protein VNF51_01540 [Candidatus Paceibacterota bacterium]|nr:hypothetical protein [Candidatus Paceibacterota bacterium]